MLKKILSVIATFCSIIAALQLASRIASILIGRICGVKNAGAIGIIGGADGPTAIFVAAKNNPFFKRLPLVACALASIIAAAAITIENGE